MVRFLIQWASYPSFQVEWCRGDTHTHTEEKHTSPLFKLSVPHCAELAAFGTHPFSSPLPPLINLRDLF